MRLLFVGLYQTRLSALQAAANPVISYYFLVNFIYVNPYITLLVDEYGCKPLLRVTYTYMRYSGGNIRFRFS